jgi:hypothetical protein
MVRNQAQAGSSSLYPTLQKAGKKTGEAIKTGAKEVEGWFNDIGNGIKDVAAVNFRTIASSFLGERLFALFPKMIF